MGWTADPWQFDFMASEAKRESLLCCRQSGKTTGTAAKVLRASQIYPFSDYLLFSPTMRQSMELFRKIMAFYDALGQPVPFTARTKSAIEFANGSRIISLPDNQTGVVGFSAPRMIVIDEASRVSDVLYRSVRPMLATSGGSLIVLSTPFGKRGWFFDVWDDSSESVKRRAEAGDPWVRTKVTADLCPRITREFLREERFELGARWYDQEYYCNFNDSIDSVFSSDVIEAMVRDDSPEPLFLQGA